MLGGKFQSHQSVNCVGCAFSAWNVGQSGEECRVCVFAPLNLHTLQSTHLTGTEASAGLPSTCSLIHLQRHAFFSLLPLPCRCGNLTFCILLLSLSSRIHVYTLPLPLFIYCPCCNIHTQAVAAVNEDPDTLFRTEASYRVTWKLMSIFKMKRNVWVQMASLKNRIKDNFKTHLWAFIRESHSRSCYLCLALSAESLKTWRLLSFEVYPVW